MAHDNPGPYDNPSILEFLSLVYETAKELLADEPPITGRRWTRPEQHCPDWCAQDHTCSVRHLGASGEHRSPVSMWKPGWGSMNATRVQPLSGQPYVELRLQVRVDRYNEQHGKAQGAYLPVVVGKAIDTLLTQLEVRARVQHQIEGWNRMASLSSTAHTPPPERITR